MWNGRQRRPSRLLHLPLSSRYLGDTNWAHQTRCPISKCVSLCFSTSCMAALLLHLLSLGSFWREGRQWSIEARPLWLACATRKRGKIIESYLLVAFFLSQDGFSLATILLMIGYGFIGSLFLFLIHTYCKTSQIVTDSIIELKHRIIQSHLEEEDNQSNRTKMTKRIVFELEQFHGFHGNGYFVLGKPLVTSIVATFATYLIILIEFKVSQ